MDRSVTFRAGASDAGNTLGVFLRQRGVSRHILTILKRTPEGILLNGEAAFTSRTLSAGDQVTIFVKEAEPPSPVAALSLPFPVIYEDEDLLVVDKPSGMAIHPSQGHHDNTLANAAAWYFQQKGESFVFRCINRLDRDTTGLLILAKNALSASILSAMLQKRQIRRTYLAAVEGDLPESGVIDAPIGRVPALSLNAGWIRKAETRPAPVTGAFSAGSFRFPAEGSRPVPWPPSAWRPAAPTRSGFI